ncbi:MAG TPA: NAD(P)/FAD-dependent oxidoreductase [bacterium]|nr:NAD(P)/FAD-dependent oxidoreductase [bacterium]
MEYEFDVLVIGAGVAGLAAARELSKAGFSTGLIEKNSRYGLETSSRNSEVIHSGIHYPAGSLKAKLCVEGNSMMYDFCGRSCVTHEKTGKLTLSTTREELQTLQELFENGQSNGVPEMKMLAAGEVKSILPCIKCTGALFTGTTGLVNSHNLMDYLYRDFLQAGGLAGFNEKVTGIEPLQVGYRISAGEGKKYTARILVNCAGLFSDSIYGMLGIDHRLYWAKGDYFTIGQYHCIKIPVYPLPGKDFLGIHLTPVIGGGLRAGPDMEYVEKKDHPYPGEQGESAFKTEGGKRKLFYEAVQRYLPEVKEAELFPEMYGIRAKLQGPGEGFRDFLIKEELPGFINLAGIDSPGLTSCLSIAKYVKNIADGIMNS